MLVIRRRAGEVVMIGDDVEVEILESSPSAVKLGIRAPKCVAVIRKEIQVVQEQNRTAALGVSDRGLQQLQQSLHTDSLFRRAISHASKPSGVRRPRGFRHG